MSGPAAQFNPNGNMPAHGGPLPPQPPMMHQQQHPQQQQHGYNGQQSQHMAMQDSYPGDTGTVIYKPNGGQPMQQQQMPMQQQMQQQQMQQQMMRGPLPQQPVDENFPPQPPMRGPGGKASVYHMLNKVY